jgi:hypothetical protein
VNSPAKSARPNATHATHAHAKSSKIGRPPRQRASEVDTRILDAAHEVFLERGFDGASIDLIA